MDIASQRAIHGALDGLGHDVAGSGDDRLAIARTVTALASFAADSMLKAV